MYALELEFVPIPIVTTWFNTHRVVEIGSAGRVPTVAAVGGGGGYVVSLLLAGMVLGTWQLGRRVRESIHRRRLKGASV